MGISPVTSRKASKRPPPSRWGHGGPGRRRRPAVTRRRCGTSRAAAGPFPGRAVDRPPALSFLAPQPFAGAVPSARHTLPRPQPRPPAPARPRGSASSEPLLHPTPHEARAPGAGAPPPTPDTGFLLQVLVQVQTSGPCVPPAGGRGCLFSEALT